MTRRMLLCLSATLAIGFAAPLWAGGDAAAGKAKTTACAACHGAQGASAAPNFPNLAGLGEKYLLKQLQDIQSGQRAVAEMQGISQVAVVGADNKIAMRVVQPGPRFESLQIIETGLSAGDQVVVEGIQKVRDGAVVNPKTAAASAATPQG